MRKKSTTDMRWILILLVLCSCMEHRKRAACRNLQTREYVDLTVHEMNVVGDTLDIWGVPYVIVKEY